MRLTGEQLAKIAKCTSVDDALAAAEAEGIELTAQQAELILSMNDDEVDEDQLKAVAGGCGGGGGSSDSSSPTYDTPSVCKYCGSTNIVITTWNVNGIEDTKLCKCGNCGFVYWAEGC